MLNLFKRHDKKINQLKDDINNFNFIRKRQTITNRTRELPSINNFEIFENRGGDIVDAKKSLLDVDEFYKKLKQRFEDVKKF